jgi:hypothetical protein
MEVTEAAESTSEKEEEQVAVEEQAVVAAPVKLHDLSVCPLLFLMAAHQISLLHSPGLLFLKSLWLRM